MRTPLLGLAAVLALTLTACSSDDSDDDRSTTGNDELRPADDVASEANEEAGGGEAALGEYVDLNDDIRVVVKDVTYEESPGGDGWFSVDTRVENAGSDDASLPDFNMTCANSTASGGYYATGTLDESGDFDLPAGSFREGTRHLIAPTDERSIGGEASPCESPAYVEIGLTGLVTDDAVTALYEVPADVLAQLG